MGKLVLLALCLATSICPVLSLPPVHEAPVAVHNSHPVTPNITPRRAPHRLLRKDTKVDLSSKVKKLAAIGSSSISGIGAGSRLGSLIDIGAWMCSRYDGSYAYLLSQNSAFGDDLKFQYESCSGSSVLEVKDEQVHRIDDNQDAILLSAGDDDFLVDILNQCVYQIFAPNFALMEASKIYQSFKPVLDIIEMISGASLEKYGRTCGQVLNDVHNQLDNSEYSKNLHSLLEAVKMKLSKDGKIFYVGYAKFFADGGGELDKCSHINWSVFFSGADKMSFQNSDAVMLTVEHRKKLNYFVEALNGKIKEAVERAGDQVIFVDPDSALDDSGRFCAPGVEEPNPLRDNLYFYELEVKDPLGMTNFKRDSGDLYNGTFEYKLDQLGALAAAAGSQLDHKIDEGNMTTDEHGKRSSNWLPDGYGRVFQFTRKAHEKTAGKLFSVMKKTFNKDTSYKGEACKPLKQKFKPECHSSANNGVVGEDYAEARDTFCKDTSKEYNEHDLKFSLEKSGSNCPKDECNEIFDLVWEKCADYHSRPEETNDKGLDEKHGPFRSSGEVYGKCGKYTFSKVDTKTEEPKRDPTETLKAKLGPVHRYPDSACELREIQESAVKKTYIADFCDKYKDTELKAGMSKLENSPPSGYKKNSIPGFQPETWHKIDVSWKENCKMDPETATLDTLYDGVDPIYKDGDKEVTIDSCSSILFRNWRNAIGNKGRGGSSQIGCIETSYKIQCSFDK